MCQSDTWLPLSVFKLKSGAFSLSEYAPISTPGIKIIIKKRLVIITILAATILLLASATGLSSTSLTVYAKKNNGNNNNRNHKNNGKAKLDCEDAATVLVVAVIGAGKATEEVDEVLDEGDIGNIFDINKNENRECSRQTQRPM